MKNKMKFKIGEFSKLCQVTVKTLRHYEEIGLMIPVEVDEWTGYRYYDISQLRCMSRIVYLKQLGFSLEEISELFADGKEFPDAELLKVKIERCKNEIEHLIWRQTELAKLENLLHKQENVMEKVFKKSLPSRIFATHRRKIDSYQELFNLCPNIIGLKCTVWVVNVLPRNIVSRWNIMRNMGLILISSFLKRWLNARKIRN